MKTMNLTMRLLLSVFRKWLTNNELQLKTHRSTKNVALITYDWPINCHTWATQLVAPTTSNKITTKNMNVKQKITNMRLDRTQPENIIVALMRIREKFWHDFYCLCTYARQKWVLLFVSFSIFARTEKQLDKSFGWIFWMILLAV